MQCSQRISHSHSNREVFPNFHFFLFASVIFNLHINPLHYSVHSVRSWQMTRFVRATHRTKCYSSGWPSPSSLMVAETKQRVAMAITPSQPKPFSCSKVSTGEKNKKKRLRLRIWNHIIQYYLSSSKATAHRTRTKSTPTSHVHHMNINIYRNDAYSLIKHKVSDEFVHHHGQD